IEITLMTMAAAMAYTTNARMSAQTMRVPGVVRVVLKMPAKGAASAPPIAKMKAANPTLVPPAAWKMKSKARKMKTMPAASPTMRLARGLPDHDSVELLLTAAPVTGSDVVRVVLVTPLYI